jgi:release factor glutamine methyltransferase
MVSTKEIYAQFVRLLSAADIPDAAFDVRCMCEQLSGMPFSRFMLRETPPADFEVSLRDMAERRCAGEPLQYLLGEWEFYGMRLFVGRGVLIPRPDTETLVESVLAHCGGRKSMKIVDLCTGSGCIALALARELPDAEISGVEWSAAALEYALRNALLHGLRVNLLCGDVLEEKTAERFAELDAVVSNPPYLTAEDMLHLQREVHHEPSMALDGGSDGLHFYRRITPLWKKTLKPGGLLAFEAGRGQAEDVAHILEENGFTDIRTERDLAGVERVIMGTAGSSKDIA